MEGDDKDTLSIPTNTTVTSLVSCEQATEPLNSDVVVEKPPTQPADEPAPEIIPKKKIFVSYRPECRADEIRTLARQLKAEFDVWIDKVDPAVGIQEVVDSCDWILLFHVLIDYDANGEDGENEITYALNTARKPALVVRMIEGAELPPLLSGLKVIPFENESQIDEVHREIVKAINGEAVVVEEPPPSTSSQPAENYDQQITSFSIEVPDMASIMRHESETKEVAETPEASPAPPVEEVIVKEPELLPTSDNQTNDPNLTSLVEIAPTDDTPTKEALPLSPEEPPPSTCSQPAEDYDQQITSFSIEVPDMASIMRHESETKEVAETPEASPAPPVEGVIVKEPELLPTSDNQSNDLNLTSLVEIAPTDDSPTKEAPPPSPELTPPPMPHKSNKTPIQLLMEQRNVAIALAVTSFLCGFWLLSIPALLLTFVHPNTRNRSKYFYILSGAFSILAMLFGLLGIALLIIYLTEPRIFNAGPEADHKEMPDRSTPSALPTFRL